MKTLFLSLLALVAARASDFTQKASGNWNSGGQTTWNEPGIPGNGDRVTCGNGMTLTIPSGYQAIVGNSPADSSGAPVLQCAGSGTLQINGTLTFRGPVVQNGPWSVGAGGVLEHDSHLAAAPAMANYTWTIGVDYLGATPPHLDLNGLAGSHVAVRIAAGSGPAGGFTYGSTGNYDGGLLHATYADISDWGTAATAWSTFNNSGGGAWYLDHCTVVRSGMIYEYGLGATGVFRILSSRISAGVSRFDLDFESGWPALTTGQRLIQNSILGAFKMYAGAPSANSGFSVVNSMLGYLVNGGRNGFAQWQDIFLNLFAASTGSPGALPASGTVDYTYVARWGYPVNPHYLTLQDLPADLTLTNIVADPGMISGTSSGDFVQVEGEPAALATVTMKKNILLPDPVGIDGGSFFNYSAFHSTAGTLRAIIENNTFTVNSGLQVDGVGGEGNTFTPGMIQSVRNNIAWCPSGCPNGYITSVYGNDAVVQSGAFVNADYNNLFNLNPTPYLFPGMTNAAFGSPNPPGPHDKKVDPQFRDTSRRMAVFGQLYLGDATGAEWNSYDSAHNFAPGDVVSHVVSGAYGNFAVNYRCIAAHVKSTSGSEPLSGSSWVSYWEPNSLESIRQAVLSGTTYTDALVGAAGDDVVRTLIKWVQKGYAPLNPAMHGAGYDGSDLGAVPAPAINAAVYATSPTQAILSYSTPDSNSCRVEVSESPSYSPLVHDVDPALFTGSDIDNRPGALNGIGKRIFLVGTRTIQTGVDSKNYSRALQQNTKHYYRITCGDQTATGDFDTKILPFGVTYQDLIPMKADGTYNFPTTSNTDRTEQLVDSQTGVLIKRVNLPADNTYNSAPFPTAGGFGESCSSTTDAHGFYHCMFNDAPQGIYPNLYAIHPVTGEARFLGAAYFFRVEIDPQGGGLQGMSGGGERVMWDALDANVVYGAVVIGATGRRTIVKWTYTGEDDPANNIQSDPQQSPHTAVDLLGGQDLSVLFSQSPLASGFDTTKFACGAEGLQSHYFLVRCPRGYQNTYAWEGVYDVGNGLPLGGGGNGQVIALAPEWQRRGTRWCGDHSYEFVGNSPIYSFAVHSVSGLASPPFDGGGPYFVTLTSAVPAADRNALTAITVTSAWDTANWGAAPAGWAPGEPVSVNPDHFLQTMQEGDMIRIDGEYMQIKTQVSSTSWIVQRGISDTSPLAHNNGSEVSPECDSASTLLTSSGGYLFWDFLASPDGTNTANWELNFGDHPVSRGGYRVDSGYPIRVGAVTDKTSWGLAPQWNVTSHPVFGGKSAPGDGNSYQKHVSMASGDASTFFDETYFVGTSLFSAQNSSAVTHLSGNLYQYHYETGVSYQGGTPITRKHFPTLAKTRGQGLVDISGPHATLGDTADDSYKYCVANAVDECHAGAHAGDIFFNHPALDSNYPFCTGGENGLDVNDICIGNFASMGVASMQYRTVNDATGALSYRPLARSYHTYEGNTLSGNLKLTYGGEWAFLFIRDKNPPLPIIRLVELKVPPSNPPDDGVNRGTFVPATLALTTPVGKNVVSARVRFGYAEQGSSTDYFCTSRHEACVATAATVDENNPFSFIETDSWTPAPCASGCTITIPVYPLHTAYYSAEFLDADGIVVATNLGVASESSAVGFDSAPPVPKVKTRSTSTAGQVLIRGPVIRR